jgi:hypothetical protein
MAESIILCYENVRANAPTSCRKFFALIGLVELQVNLHDLHSAESRINEMF